MLKSIRPDRFRKKILPPAPPPPEPLKILSYLNGGVIYVAYGQPAKAACQASIASLKRMHPSGLQVAVISDTPIPGADTQIVRPELDIGAREYKTQAYQYSPYDHTLYLDADTLVVGSLAAGFSALAAGWDIVAALDYRQTVGRVDHLPQDDIDATIAITGTGEYPHINTGMLFFRKSTETEELFNLWHSEWLNFKYRDQGAFVRALHQSNVKLWTLAWQWNTHRQERALHVFHNHHQVDRTWKGLPQ